MTRQTEYYGGRNGAGTRAPGVVGMASLQTAVCGETAANRCAGYSGAHAVPQGISAAPWEFWEFWELWEFWVFYGCEWYAPLGASGGFLWQGIGVRVSTPAGHPIAPKALKAPKRTGHYAQVAHERVTRNWRFVLSTPAALRPITENLQSRPRARHAELAFRIVDARHIRDRQPLSQWSRSSCPSCRVCASVGRPRM